MEIEWLGWGQQYHTRYLNENWNTVLRFKKSFEIIVLLKFSCIILIETKSFIIWFRIINFYFFSFLSSSSLRILKWNRRVKWIKNQKKRRFMAKGKDIRVRVILECTCCAQKSVNKESTGISRYITQKNRHNTPSRLELRKFCPCCCKHTIHAEIKK